MESLFLKLLRRFQFPAGILSLEGFRTLREISNRPERWNIETIEDFETSSKKSSD
ncbi:hypothetical protein SDC9_64169 [bioreactor metagenome]|uniref:Uncharacterized protein n=1 Tax=bioreactor metagenome TaxID=1076179 RepID=A0A644XNK7_9ZZZZ